MAHQLRILALTAVATATLAATAPLDAQAYFGRNKVQYDSFDWQVLKTPHFDLYFYPEMDESIGDFARMSERWYERFARSFQHEFEKAKPLIVYADHPDFQQTNTLQQQISEGTGGVTESLKNRVIMPMTGSYWDTDHVLGHELVHAFQYNIAQTNGGAGFRGLVTLPLWLVEGMAEYLSVGREDALTAMWLRDAVRRDDFPTIDQLTRDTRFFPYRFGQALWAYVGGTYGDDAIYSTFRRSLQVGFQPALTQILGVDADTLSVQWRREVEAIYGPLMEGRSDPDDIGGTLLLTKDNGGRQNIAPSLSPDGTRLAFISEKDLFSFDLFLADAETGEVIRKLTSSTQDPHADAIRFIDAAGSWSPDGEQFAYVTFAKGDNEINVIRSSNGSLVQRIDLPDIGAVNNVGWSPDGRYLAFTGLVGGFSDLYIYDLETEQIRQLTDDRYADMHPTWSPDGSTLAFASDRGPKTNFETLEFSTFQIATIDVASGNIQVLDLLGDVRHSNPQYSPDGNRLLFLSDADGFSDVYATDLRTRSIQRLTTVATGISGITAMSPALSVASESGRIAVSVFDEFGFEIHTLPADTRGEPVSLFVETDELLVGRALPPADIHRFDRVTGYLVDPQTGLVPDGTYVPNQAEPYTSDLSLDFLGQPTIGIGTGDAFGNYVGGGSSAFFSDMLGDEVLGVVVQAQGQLQDIGGQVVYGDLSNRLNWQVGAARVPSLFFASGFAQDGSNFFQQRWRIFSNTLNALLSYPLSQTRRFEFGVNATRFGYAIEEDVFELDQFGRIVGFERRDRPDLAPDAINLGQATVAYVGDNSIQGFVGPIRGGRFRLEVQQSFLDQSFTTLIADWRRYYAPVRNLTLAARGLHFGRYGVVDQTQQGGGFNRLNAIQPLFLGFETLVRGYAFESFQAEECQTTGASQGGNGSACPVFDRLFGQRVGVASIEARVPLLGVPQYGLINFPFVPTELSIFFDAGVAYDSPDDVDFSFVRSSVDRIPVFSTGISARMNILGVLILESYYALPFQRPDRGWHWGFNIAPGW